MAPGCLCRAELLLRWEALPSLPPVSTGTIAQGRLGDQLDPSCSPAREGLWAQSTDPCLLTHTAHESSLYTMTLRATEEVLGIHSLLSGRLVGSSYKRPEVRRQTLVSSQLPEGKGWWK